MFFALMHISDFCVILVWEREKPAAYTCRVYQKESAMLQKNIS